jgi:hypothetical protein
MSPYLQLDLKRLLEITRGCQPDMHEPDEQGVRARVIGTILDNAMGDRIDSRLLERGAHEIVVVLERFDESLGFMTERFSLANLVALARLANPGSGRFTMEETIITRPEATT